MHARVTCSDQASILIFRERRPPSTRLPAEKATFNYSRRHCLRRDDMPDVNDLQRWGRSLCAVFGHAAGKPWAGTLIDLEEQWENLLRMQPKRRPWIVQTNGIGRRSH